jgi:hypothetical protein
MRAALEWEARRAILLLRIYGGLDMTQRTCLSALLVSKAKVFPVLLSPPSPPSLTLTPLLLPTDPTRAAGVHSQVVAVFEGASKRDLN